MDTYADDLAKLTEALDLKNTIHVGYSTGGREVARYIGRHGTKRVAKAVLNAEFARLHQELGVRTVYHRHDPGGPSKKQT